MAKILIVDDSKLILHIAKTILVKQGQNVLLAEDGKTGLETAAREHPDLILLDLILPGMDGYEVCRQIKENSAISDIPIIMITSKSEPADKIRGLEMGASDYVTKPFDEGELMARVNIHLHIRNLHEILKQKNRQLKELANRDGLTGLYNHRYFQETILKNFKRAIRYHESISCVMLDIDHFKKFNDSYGHQAGDMALKTLGRLINESIRDSDLAARYGGEEFVLLMYHTELKEALVISERLRKLVEEYKFTIDDAEINITISLGIVSFPNQNMEIPDARTLIECADKALYKAKEQGRNRIEIF